MAELYVGKLFDTAAKSLGDQVQVDSADLTTHGIVIGMTGSGKTGFSIDIIEEVLSAKIPVIVIDPKGDMTNLALAFDRLAPDQFAPWVDAEQASREGKTREQAAEEAATTWQKGLAEWGIDAARVAAYAAGRAVRILTPGSSAGISVNLIDSMAAPGVDFDANEETLRDEIDSIVTALLALIKVRSDPVSGREYILLFTLIENAWRQNQGLSLETLIGQVATPPIDKVGALPLEAFYPQKERSELMLSLNNLLASPPFEAWRRGEPVEIDAWLQQRDGKTPVTIVYTAHLNDEERILITALLLNKVVTWMRRQPGTSELRCLVYMDEIFGYFPPTMNPPTKKPLLTLLKQARAFGVGVLLATQNPVDLDYRGLANMGFWAIGRLQTTQDQARVKEGIEAALADAGGAFDFDSMIAGVQKRVFLVHDIHRKTPMLVHSRFAMSYLRGPITLEEIRGLERDQQPAPEAAPRPTATPPGPSPAPPTPPPPPGVVAPMAPAGPPILPAPLRARFLRQQGGGAAYPLLFVKASARYKVEGSSTESTRILAFPIAATMAPGEVLAAQPVAIDDAAFTDAPPPGLQYADVPAWLQTDGAKALERLLKDRLDDRLAISVLYDPATKTSGTPDDTPDSLARRIEDSPDQRARRDAIEAKLRSKQAELADRRGQENQRQLSKWADIGGSILGGIFGGRRRSAGSILRKAGSGRSGGATIARLESEVASLATQLDEMGRVDPARFEFREVKPAASDVALIRYDVIWAY